MRADEKRRVKGASALKFIGVVSEVASERSRMQEHPQLVRRQELFEAEMLVVPKPHKLESTEKCRAGLNGRVVD